MATAEMSYSGFNLFYWLTKIPFNDFQYWLPPPSITLGIKIFIYIVDLRISCGTNHVIINELIYSWSLNKNICVYFNLILIVFRAYC